MAIGQWVISLACGHMHHVDCIKDWLKKQRFCPLCKQEAKVYERGCEKEEV
jgi:NADH pyrophosphatase NudC (nudix superfamily)